MTPQGGLTQSEYGTVFGTGLGLYLVKSVIIAVVFMVLRLSICLGVAFRIVLTQSNSVAVLPLGLTKLEGQCAINVPALMAAVLLSVLPPLLILFALTTPRPEGRGSRSSRARVPVSPPTAPGRTRNG